MKNRVKQFLEARGLTAYQFIKETGIAPATGYKLAKDDSHLPAIRVLEVICDTYRVQPGELVEWVDEEPGPAPKRTQAEVMQQQAIATADTELDETIEGLGLSVSTYNKWKRWCAGQEINTVGELIRELKSIPQRQVVENVKGIGDSAVKELSEALKKFDFEWK